MHPPGRRVLLAGAAALVANRAVGAERAQTMIVAGPAAGPLDRFAGRLAPALGRALPGRSPVERKPIGGMDGVTGANQFEALGEPDGRTALLLPGFALIAWLAGESRVQFDPAPWVPLWAVTCTAALVSRAALTPGSRLRFTTSSPVGLELPALLALDLLGIEAVLNAPREEEEARLIRGAGSREAILAAARDGFQPVMTFGAEPSRDPALPSVPTAFELAGGRAPSDLLAAMQAAATAVQLSAGLVLPRLTPASAVAAWRRACDALSQEAGFAQDLSGLGLRPTRAGAIATFPRDVTGTPPTVLALRNWLANRHGWRPD